MCVKIRLWPLRRNDSSRVLIGASGMWRSDWRRRDVGALSGQSACRLLALPREVIDSTRAKTNGSLHSAATCLSGAIKQGRMNNQFTDWSMPMFLSVQHFRRCAKTRKRRWTWEQLAEPEGYASYIISTDTILLSDCVSNKTELAATNITQEKTKNLTFDLKLTYRVWALAFQ